MLGAIVGDIAGSRFEFNPIKTKEFEIFWDSSFFTDDTVCTIGILDGMLNNNYTNALLREGRIYIDATGCGPMFKKWLKSDNPKPYNSFGNGSAMRVSPIGWQFNTLEETEIEAKKSAEITHNHEDGIAGAVVVAGAMFMARNGSTKSEIKEYCSKFYNINKTLSEIRPTYKFQVKCSKSIPESIICFLEGNSYEDTVRNAISLGGDADTMAAISGCIAEAFWYGDKDKGIPEEWILGAHRAISNDARGSSVLQKAGAKKLNNYDINNIFTD